MQRESLTEQEITEAPGIPEGRRLKALIALHGMRVVDVANAARMGVPTLYRCLAGTRDFTEDERARVLAVIGGGRA